MKGAPDRWSNAGEYERFMGRWSRLVAREFLSWIAVPWRQRWLDVGCGTGALSETILSRCQPIEVVGVDRSLAYATAARAARREPLAHFLAADAARLPLRGTHFDAAVSGLVINFIPDPARAVEQMLLCVRPGGAVALYAWDYAGRMEMLRHFWDAAVSLDPGARELDEGRRFPICTATALAALFTGAGVDNVETRALEVPAEFESFEDFWQPFQSGDAPAPGYCVSLSEAQRAKLRDALRERLPVEPDGRIELVARAWGVRGERRED